MELVLTAAGAVTSVGHSVDTACAAIRAGIARPRKLREFRVVDEESQEDIPVTGHPIHGYTDGFQLLGRWLRLARGAVEDGLSHPGMSGATGAFWQKTGLVVVTPPADDEVFLSEPGGALEQMREGYLQPLHRALGLAIAEPNVALMPLGHAGTAAGLQHGMQWMASRGLERVLLVAVDSYLDELLLQQLASQSRLKSEDHPVGLMPGEAGVCLLVETEASARRRGMESAVFIDKVATGREPDHFGSGRQNMGRGLAGCIQEVLAATPSAFEGDLYSDLNGEPWRAHEWGCVRTHLATRLGAARLHIPGTCVGEVGAASGALGVCLAAHDLSRGHNPQAHALVISSSEHGEVGCLSIRRKHP
ncbi:hypothetical protein D7V97_12640 [Corallococcus sp. CA053C]|uniref:hypothetical protein n=1 Tax=Corallococcus sp. CA053C TaxID=2316732 RepID=UPI000EA18D8C|nr:hypothetical protein [Corallococcus sp. CA053C]RKH10866.1 hypothetical protein D7V97_12640 [Corallococcus sp. CA053C]